MALYAFDGTGDRWDRESEITQTAIVKNGFFPGERYLTNSVLFYKEYSQSNVKIGVDGDRIKHKYYFSGVGSSGVILDTIFGGAFGVGVGIIANRAFKKLEKNFEAGDYDIDIVAYSRGAASARIFAHKVNKKFKRIKDKNGKKLTEAPRIRFLGLFDTVVSLAGLFHSKKRRNMF